MVPIRTYARIAGGSGILFAVLFTVALWLIRRAPALGVPDASYTRFYTGGDHGALVTFGLPAPDVARALSVVGYALLFVYGMRAAGMFMITTTSLVKAGGLLPRWLAVLSYLAAAFLMVSTTFHPLLALIFPAWVVVVGVVLLWGARAPERAGASEIPAAGATDR